MQYGICIYNYISKCKINCPLSSYIAIIYFYALLKT